MTVKKIKVTKKSKAAQMSAPVTKAVDKEVAKVLKRKGLVPEVKLLDNVLTVTNLPKSNAAYSTLLNNVVGGSAESQRDGNIIQMKRLRFSAIIAPKSLPATGGVPGAGDNTECMVGVRFLIVQDKQTISDTTPALTDVLASLVTNDLPLISPQTIVQQKRFKILYNSVKFCEIGKSYHKFSKVIKLNRPAIYNGTASTDIQKNGIYLYCWYNDFGVPTTGADVNDGPRFIYWSRLEYTDN